MVKTLKALQTLRRRPIFQNLQTLKIIMANPPISSHFIHCLLFRSIRTVDLGIRESEAGSQNRHAISQIILGTRLLHLDELHFTVWDISVISCPIITRAISDAINAQPLLQRLEVLDLEHRFVLPWSAASSLRHLTHLTFSETNALCNPWYSTTPPSEVAPVSGFGTLKSISLGVTPELLSAVLSAVTSAILEDLEVLLYARAEDEESSLHGRLGEVHRFVHLVSLRLTFVGSVMQWSDFDPMLHCTELKVLVLRGKYLSSVVGDQELNTMSLSWPNLEDLEVTDSDPHPNGLASAAPTATFTGLSHLSKNCPRLQKLMISVDARQPHLSSSAHVVIAAAMEDVRLPYSRTGDTAESHEAVALLIQSMWPGQEIPPREEFGTWLNSRLQITTFDIPLAVEEFDVWRRIWTMVYMGLRHCQN